MLILYLVLVWLQVKMKKRMMLLNIALLVLEKISLNGVMNISAVSLDKLAMNMKTEWRKKGR